MLDSSILQQTINKYKVAFSDFSFSTIEATNIRKHVNNYVLTFTDSSSYHPSQLPSDPKEINSYLAKFARKYASAPYLHITHPSSQTHISNDSDENNSSKSDSSNASSSDSDILQSTSAPPIKKPIQPCFVDATILSFPSKPPKPSTSSSVPVKPPAVTSCKNKANTISNKPPITSAQSDLITADSDDDTPLGILMTRPTKKPRNK